MTAPTEIVYIWGRAHGVLPYGVGVFRVVGDVDPYGYIRYGIFVMMWFYIELFGLINVFTLYDFCDII